MRKYLAEVKGKSLIWCINLVAGLAIFLYVVSFGFALYESKSLIAACHSFGYDQGMMGGVNTSPDYVRVMGLGYSTCVARTVSPPIYEFAHENGPGMRVPRKDGSPLSRSLLGRVASSVVRICSLFIVVKPSELVFVSPVYYFGTLLGCLAAGVIGDKYGTLNIKRCPQT